ncbi:MAG TPA: trehalose-phosphatase [Fontimonas sp.]
MTTEFSSLRSPPLLASDDAYLSDFDGTLVELAARPEAIRPAAGLAGWLQQLRLHLDDAVAIVTGRRLADVERYLAPLQLIGAGAHGAERRLSHGGPIAPVVEPLDPTMTAQIEAAIADLQDVWVENKTYALAVHFRQNPAAADDCLGRVQHVAAAYSQVIVLNGHAVVEVRRAGIGKGAAVGDLLSHPVFAGRRPFFVGDDFADEEGFHVVQAAGGVGIKVGGGETAAHYRLADVAAVHEWIRESLVHMQRVP